ncbi:PASTA domain-containing protein [Leptolyngbya sp. 7M]|uniref:PASTA domain-containing protein n=1 Tax=Leptolyngbya sp. 7M TaxID=2812896 RepID=UPI001B8B2B64|nr:PASTA domain-containing protein [Leptolyngbya sp. 7M]QYO66095.1 PASTA domain-containing protein [Leptolyngbya sp. 7M]
MNVASGIFNATGKLLFLVLLLAAFLGGMAGVVYMSLAGSEIKVPDLVGKDFVASEKELAALGLKIKRRADRPSSEPINTVLEQLPRPGETVKTGQLILVVTSKAGVDADTPKSLIEDIQSDDTEKIEELISDKPKRSKTATNSNTAKKTADTRRDVIANSSTSSDAPANKSEDADKPKTADQSKPQDTGTQPERNRNTSTRPGVNTQPRDRSPGTGEQRPPTRP